MLSYNVAGLLRSTPGTARRYEVHAATIAIADDLRLAAPIEGVVRLSSTGRGILASAELTTALAARCGRCLVPVVTPVAVSLEEEALPSIDIDTGQPVDAFGEPDALRVNEHHELDLEETIRSAISLAEPIVPLCQPGCLGLCPTCGAELNEDPGHDHGEAPVDARLARLAARRASGTDD